MLVRRLGEYVMRKVHTVDGGRGVVTVELPAGTVDAVLIVEVNGDSVRLEGAGSQWLRKVAGDLLDAADDVDRWREVDA